MDNLEKAFQDKEFIEKVLQMEPVDAVNAFSDRGVECTVEDLLRVKDALGAAEGAINEADLESVTGGGKSFDNKVIKFFKTYFFPIPLIPPLW